MKKIPNPFEDMRPINKHDVELFLAIHGQKGSKTLSLLGKFQPFYNAINSEIGRELLKDVQIKMEYLLECIIRESYPKKMSETHVKAEYRVLRDILYKWSERIEKYLMAKNKIKER